MRKTADDMDISDFEFDQYLEGDSSLSQAYRNAAQAVEPSVNVEKIVFNELDSHSSTRVQIPRLETPAKATIKRAQKRGYDFRWLGPMVGVTCVAVLAVGLGLRSGLFNTSESFETIASKEQSDAPQSGALIADENMDGQLLTQVELASEVTPQEQASFQNTAAPDSVALNSAASSAAESDSQDAAADNRDNTDLAGPGASAGIVVAKGTESTNTPLASVEQTPVTTAELNDTGDQGAALAPAASSDTVLADAEPEIERDDQFAEQQPQATGEQVTQPVVMAPADAMLEADGPRSPAVMDSDSLLEPQDAGETAQTATGAIAIASRQRQSGSQLPDSAEIVTANKTVVAVQNDPSQTMDTVETVSESTQMSEQELENALVETEKKAENLESSNSELRDRLAALEEKVFSATVAGVETNQLQSLDAITDNDLDTVLDTNPDPVEREQLILALSSIASQSEQGRQLTVLSNEEISQLLATDNNRERYRNPLLSVIGAASRSQQADRLQALLEIYRQTYPDALQPTPDLLQ